jgi:septal ring-binding cell division protein DamX
LEKKAGTWVIPDADDFPARADKISPLLEKLLKLQNNRLITQTAASHKRLQVANDDFVRRVEFRTQDGSSHVLYLGSSPTMGSTHFRLAGQDEVYLTGDLNSYAVSPQASAYIDTQLISQTAADIKQMTVQNPQGQMTFTRDEKDDWVVQELGPDQPTDSTQLSSLITRLTSLSMIRPLGKEAKPDYGLNPPQAVVQWTLQPSDGEAQDFELQIGVKDDNNDYIVKFSGSPYYVVVTSFAVEDFVSKTPTDFVLQPTPEPQATPSQ